MYLITKIRFGNIEGNGSCSHNTEMCGDAFVNTHKHAKDDKTSQYYCLVKTCTENKCQMFFEAKLEAKEQEANGNKYNKSEGIC